MHYFNKVKLKKKLVKLKISLLPRVRDSWKERKTCGFLIYLWDFNISTLLFVFAQITVRCNLFSLFTIHILCIKVGEFCTIFCACALGLVKSIFVIYISPFSAGVGQTEGGGALLCIVNINMLTKKGKKYYTVFRATSVDYHILI